MNEEKTRLPDDIRRAAIAAGLEKALTQFPGDVLLAAQAAEADRKDMPPLDGMGEPWPPMRMRSGR